MTDLDRWKAETEAFVKERDEMLLALDPVKVRAFYAKHNPQVPPLPSDDMAMLVCHKARTAALSLPIEERVLSRDWLRERNSHHFGGKELDDA